MILVKACAADAPTFATNGAASIDPRRQRLVYLLLRKSSPHIHACTAISGLQPGAETPGFPLKINAPAFVKITDFWATKR